MRSTLPGFLLLACLACLSGPVVAQTPGEITAERARITSERERAEADFVSAEKACYARFAVNDCLDKARNQRREALSDLRRQEVGLNDLERRRRAAERLRELEQRQAEQATREEEGRAKAQEEAQSRQDRASQKAEEAARLPAARGPREDKVLRQPDVEGNKRREAERARQAQEHRSKVEERASRNRKQAAPLPIPQN